MRILDQGLAAPAYPHRCRIAQRIGFGKNAAAPVGAVVDDANSGQ
jgi:hypothetical protein